MSRRCRPLRIAVLGAGTVGREVVRALCERSPELTAADGRPLVLAGIAVRDVDGARGRGLPADLLTDAPAHLVASPDTDVIVELMGGDEPARTLISAALAAGKPVITANKHVIAHHGAELEGLARRTGVSLRFEASVGGGIPVLGPIATELAGNRLTAIRGIVNGTTNYILSALAFGTWLDPAEIPTVADDGPGAGQPGITGIGASEIAAATAAGRTIKLIAAATRSRDDRIAASVLPTTVPLESPLGRTGGVFNHIEVDGEPVGTVAFSGPGAGGPATSSAVLGDLVAVARDLGSTWAGLSPAAVAVRR